MSIVWAQRREDLVSDCIVSPDVFHQMVDRLGEFAVPYQHALETATGQRNLPLYLQGLLSHLPGKNAEDIATFVDVERQVIQDFIGTIPWDHRPLITPTVSAHLTSVVPRNILLLKSPPDDTPHPPVNVRRRKDEHPVGTKTRGISERLSRLP
jgi:hypothetical protein